MTDPRPLTNGELLNRIDRKLAVIESKIDQIADHEDRLRQLEKARYQSAWITSIMSSALASGIVYFIVRALP
jgi:type IV secretory pathway component VirB8